MDEVLRALEMLDGMSTFLCNEFCRFLLLLSAVFMFFLGAVICIGVFVWDDYEDEIRATATKVKIFFLERILRLFSL